MPSSLIRRLGVTLLSCLSQVLADIVPHLPYDLNTTSACTFWYDNFGAMTCEQTAEVYLTTMEKVVELNPLLSIVDGYCVGWTDVRS